VENIRHCLSLVDAKVSFSLFVMLVCVMNPHVIVVYECLLVWFTNVSRKQKFSDRAADLHAVGSGFNS